MKKIKKAVTFGKAYEWQLTYHTLLEITQEVSNGSEYRFTEEEAEAVILALNKLGYIDLEETS